MTRDETSKNVIHGESSGDSEDKPRENGSAKIRPQSSRDKQNGESDKEQVGHEDTDNPREPFRIFRERSYIDLLEKVKEHKVEETAKKHKETEVHLVDGELKFGQDDDGLEKKETKPDEKLVEGNPLPESVGNFPDKLLGKPVEEIDPNIPDKTFVVIAKRIKKKFIYRFSATKAFFVLSPWNPIRRVSVYIATNQFFDYFVIFTILVNCVLLAALSDTENEIPEYVFLGIYSAEMIIKLLARGFILNKYTYLRDAWNWLDFGVIVIGCVTILIEKVFVGSTFNLAGLRTFRVLRALKTVSIIPGLRTIVNALLRAFKMLMEVITLTVFVLMVFALFALQVYMGTLRQKCIHHVSNAGYNSTLDGDYNQFYDQWVKNTTNWMVDSGGNYIMCGNASGAGACDNGYVCLSDLGENPNFGFTGFDNFLWAMLNCFQLITLDFWEDVYDKVLRTSGPWNVLFFMAVVFLGSFYLLNLMLAVVAMSYEEEAESAGKLQGAKLAQRWKAKPPDWMVKIKEKKDRDREKARQKKKRNPIYDISVLKVTTKKFKEQKMKREKKQILQVQPAEDNTVNEPAADKNKLAVIADNLATPSSVETHRPLVKKQSKDSGFSNQSHLSTKSSSSRQVKRQDSQEQLGNPHDAEERIVHSSDTTKGLANGGFEDSKSTPSTPGTVSERLDDYVIITGQ